VLEKRISKDSDIMKIIIENDPLAVTKHRKPIMPTKAFRDKKKYSRKSKHKKESND
jgi:hypothetical protein